MLIKTQRATRSKPRNAQIDWGHPLSKQLVTYVPFNEGGGFPRELVRSTGRSPLLQGAGAPPSWTATTYGLALMNDDGAGNQGVFWPAGGPNFNDAQPMTLFAISGPLSNTGVQNILLRYYNTLASAANPWQIRLDNVNAVIKFMFNGGESANANSIPIAQFNDGKMHALAATRMNTTGVSTIYLDDHVHSTSFIGGVVASAYGPMATADGTGGNAWRGAIACIAAWRRVLSRGEIQALVENPYQLLQPQLYRRFFFSPPAPVNIPRFVSPIINMPLQMP